MSFFFPFRGLGLIIFSFRGDSRIKKRKSFFPLKFYGNLRFQKGFPERNPSFQEIIVNYFIVRMKAEISGAV